MGNFYFTYEERRHAIHSLIELKNKLIHEGHYTDAIDDMLCKLMAAKRKSDFNLPNLDELTGLRVGEVIGLRWCDIDLEEGVVNVNHTLVQNALGHTDIATTLNIYTDVTKELKKTEFQGLDAYFMDK
ncbi:MAG: hypothetical protein HFH23_17910 [Ruminococcus sp.]|nr:hypothetical protein [Ruminococcus sp.]